MSKPSIALLHYSCPPVVGGVEEVIRQQALLFHRYYYPVKVFAGAGNQFGQEFEVEIHPLLGSRNPDILSVQKDALQNRVEIERLTDAIVRYLRNSLVEFDVLIAHNVLSMHYNLPLTLALHRLAAENVCRIVAWNHDSPFFYENFPEYLKQKPWQILRTYNPKIHYTTISESRRHQFERLFEVRNSIEVIPNGIDPIRFFRLDRNTVRIIQENRLFEADLILVQPSRLHPRKNIECSIHVLAELHKRGIQAKLLLTGAYDPHEEKTLHYYQKLIHLAHELNVKPHLLIMAEYYFTTGEKLQADRITIRDLYLIADVLFMPSLQEGFGIPLLEAAMIKLPIVCSDIPPFREIGNESVLYFSLDESPAAITEKMLDFLERLPPHRMYRNVIREFVWDNIFVRQLRPFLRKILS
jgi:glycosyltransferase involved in cell wall biosynthesis